MPVTVPDPVTSRDRVSPHSFRKPGRSAWSTRREPASNLGGLRFSERYARRTSIARERIAHQFGNLKV